jgi:hypothetical protein
MNFIRATFMPGRGTAPPPQALGERSEILIVGTKPADGAPVYEIITRLSSGVVQEDRSWKDFVDLHDTWRRVYPGLRIRFPKKIGKMESVSELQAIRGDLENYLQSMSQITALHHDLGEFLNVKPDDLKQGFTPQTQDDPFAPKPTTKRAPIVSEMAAMGPTGSQIPNPASAPAARLLMRQTQMQQQQQRAPTQRAPTQRAPTQRAPTRAPTRRSPPQTMNGPGGAMPQQPTQMQMLMQQMSSQVPKAGYSRAPSRMPAAGGSGRMPVGRARTQQGYGQGIMQPGYAPSGRSRFGPSRVMGGPSASRFRRKEDLL